MSQISIPIPTPLMCLIADGVSDGMTAMEVVSFLMAVVVVEMVGMG